jgi:hypothetical protein
MSAAAKIMIARKRVKLEIKRGSARGFQVVRQPTRKIMVERRAFGAAAGRLPDRLSGGFF